MSAYDQNTERWVKQSVEKALVSAASMAGVAVQFDGMQHADTESLEEWVRFFCLTLGRREGRDTDVTMVPIFQASCFAKFAERRVDGQTDAPWILAGKVQKAIGQTSIAVKTYGDASPDTIGHLTLHAGNPRYIGQVPDAESVHMVEVTFTGSFNK